MKPDFYEVNLCDTFLLLSSGGLHDYIRKERIREIVLANGENVEKSWMDLIEEALVAGSADNITVVLAHGMFVSWCPQTLRKNRVSIQWASVLWSRCFSVAASEILRVTAR